MPILAAATKTGIFKKAHSGSSLWIVVLQSANMIGIAAGSMQHAEKYRLSALLQCLQQDVAFEQVRNSIGYPHLNVKIGATHAGISVGEDGATHQCNEDIALMRRYSGNGCNQSMLMM